MLMLTENATTIIQELVDDRALPDGAGLRIASAPDEGDLTITTAETPETDDEVVENSGARVFLETRAAMMLDDKVLDARMQDRRVQFLLGSQ